MTIAKIITDINGHRSQPSRQQDIRNKARKNHRIMSRGDDGPTLPPRMIGVPATYPAALIKSHGTLTSKQQVWAVA
jgi:hypothetical protein